MNARASGIGQPTMPPICEDRYSDFRPVMRMRNDQPVRHWLQMFLMARVVIAKADLFA